MVVVWVVVVYMQGGDVELAARMGLRMHTAIIMRITISMLTTTIPRSSGHQLCPVRCNNPPLGAPYQRNGGVCAQHGCVSADWQNKRVDDEHCGGGQGLDADRVVCCVVQGMRESWCVGVVHGT